MGIKQRNMILALVIVFELACLYHVYPKKALPGDDPMGQELSKICLNAVDLFQAYKRSNFLVAVKGLNPGVLNVMFYADRTPRVNKKYLVYFGPLPLGLRHRYSCDSEGEIQMCINNDINFSGYKRIVNNLVEIYGSTDECIDISRDGFQH